jgi:hypothetical protein
MQVLGLILGFLDSWIPGIPGRTKKTNPETDIDIPDCQDIFEYTRNIKVTVTVT